tara:strand:+ start:6054 stop:6695 length:642 start_codon:yes stop_codon:yes gene_type:complete
MFILDEESHIPSQTQMFYLVRNLIDKCNKLEHKVDQLQKYANITKKQINALDWLNENITLSLSFKSWIDSIDINQENLISIFKLGYIEGVYQILETYLPIDATVKHPIKCFKQNSNTFFIYEENKWSRMNLNDFKYLTSKLSGKIIRAFNIWKTDNMEKIDNSDKMYDLYVDYMRIVLGENKSNEVIIQKLKSKMYTYLKCDLKNIVKYEFSF